MAGGYAGYALSWLDVDTELGDQRVLRAAISALSGVAIIATSIALERACRVSSDQIET